MNVLIFLVPVALTLGLIGLLGFLWALKTGQYDDLDGAPWRILEDDDIAEADAPPEREMAEISRRRR